MSGVREHVSGVCEYVSGVREHVSGVREHVSGVREHVSGVRECVSGVRDCCCCRRPGGGGVRGERRLGWDWALLARRTLLARWAAVLVSVAAAVACKYASVYDAPLRKCGLIV